MQKIAKFSAAVLACGLVLATGYCANAQGATQASQPPSSSAAGHRHQGTHRLQKLAKELGLTDSQKAQIKTILKNAREQRQAIKQNSQLSQDQKRAQMRELAKTTRSQIAAALTPAQREHWKQLRKEHKQNKSDKHA